MEDPSGIVLMAGGARPSEGKEVMERVVIEQGVNKGIVVRVSTRPAGQGGGELSLPTGTEEMNAFGSWPEAQAFLVELMGGDASPEVEDESEGPLVEESEDIQEPPMAEHMAPKSPSGPVEFGGQRSYSR
jgi:hypothetical protein